mgnify:CR=1 FL=1
MNKQKRIAIVLPNLQGGGVERVRLLLAGQFVAEGFAVDLVLMEQRGELISDVPDGCRIVDLHAPRMRSLPLRLRRYLREQRPDAVLAAMWPVTGLSGLALRLAGLPTNLVVSEHNDLRRVPAIKPIERLALRLFGRWFYGRASKVVAVSKGVADSLTEVAGVSPDRVEVIHNPVRQAGAAIEPGDGALLSWWREGEARLIAVGSLKPQKDYPTLLAGLGQLRRTVDARLIVLGEGPERASLERIAAGEGLADAVRFPGFRPSPQPYLEQADLLVLSSRWEGLGNVITEALLAGCRVVSTDCPSGPAELPADGQYGRLVPVGDAAKLADAITAALAEPHDPKPGMEWAGRFNPKAAARAYLNLLFPDEA